MAKYKRIHGHAEVHAETRYVLRADGSEELVIDAFRVEHRDGSVEFATSPQEAFNKIVALDAAAKKKTEQKDPHAAVVWVTTIEWHVPPGTDIPTCEART